uniref:Uncharacterized protein n=1 Tax=Anguilla anguilla TaxID=7936 RepID=A0A0E9TSE9_ANGAN
MLNPSFFVPNLPVRSMILVYRW